MKGTLDNFLSPLMANQTTNCQTIDTPSLSCPPFSLRVSEITLTTTMCNVNCLSGVGDESSTRNREPECHAVEDDSGCGYRASSAHDGECARATGRGSHDHASRPDSVLADPRHAGQGIYGLPAIAELLSGNGVVVTAKTLKTYL